MTYCQGSSLFICLHIGYLPERAVTICRSSNITLMGTPLRSDSNCQGETVETPHWTTGARMLHSDSISVRTTRNKRLNVLTVPCALGMQSVSHYLIPACCYTANSRCSPASSRTPTETGSTGRRQSPTPGSSRLQHPSRAPKRRTPARPASMVSGGSCAPTPPSR